MPDLAYYLFPVTVYWRERLRLGGDYANLCSLLWWEL